MKTSPLRLAFLFPVLASLLTAQTWIGGGSDWDAPSSWNPATVPDGTGATATFTAAGLNPEFNTDLTMTASHTLDGIAFTADGRPITLNVGDDTDSVTLALAGAGLRNDSAFQQRFWLRPMIAQYPTAITLEFRNQATVAGDVRLIAIGSDRHLNFRDQSSAGSATIAAYQTDFYDQSSAGSAIFDQFSASIVTFHDQASAGSATFSGAMGQLIFADSSTAANATMTLPSSYGAYAEVLFRDTSNAGSALLTSYKLEFSGQASAAQARLASLGFQVYSSHGSYAGYFASLVFRDQSTAGSATLNTNAMGVLSVTDDATTAQATITNQGTATWSGRATFGNARLIAGSGTYYGVAGYNQQAPLVTTGGVYFKDQASGGDGVIEISSGGAWLDFSGLYTGTGITGRAALPADGSATGDTLPDDARVISFGSIHNTIAGGNIYLGATTLRVGGDNSDATLSARIRDVGGAYGSASGERLHGGTLIKMGTGTLIISNPDNSYGSTLVTNGTLRLDGGRISNATIAATGRLTGNGSVQGSLENSGLVSPGNSPGTITVQGNYAQAATGVLNIEFASPTSFDHLAVTGTAALDGTLNLTLPAGFAPVGSASYSFLTASTITGQFATVNAPFTNSATLSGQLAYGPGGVSLQVTQHPFADFGGDSPAATALGAHFDATLANATGDYRALIAGLNTLDTAAEVGAALESLAPDRYATLIENAFLTAAGQQAAQDRRFAAARADQGARGFSVFFEGGQHRAEFDASAGLPAAKSSLAGGPGGVAWQRAGFTFGAGVTQESGDAELDALGSRADLESTAPTVFFQYAGNQFFVNAAATFSDDDYELQRHVAYTGTTALATSSGSRRDLAVTVGREFRAGAWTLTPQLGVLASEWQLDGFTETGAAGANLTLPDQSLRSLRTRVGVDVAAPGPHFAPRLSVAWLHETEDERSLHATFANGPAYAAPGRPAPRDLVQASVGFDWFVTKRGAFYATLAGAWGDGASVTSDLSAGFRWKF